MDRDPPGPAVVAPADCRRLHRSDTRRQAHRHFEEDTRLHLLYIVMISSCFSCAHVRERGSDPLPQPRRVNLRDVEVPILVPLPAIIMDYRGYLFFCFSVSYRRHHHCLQVRLPSS
jgi:hypothetical protein